MEMIALERNLVVGSLPTYINLFTANLVRL